MDIKYLLQFKDDPQVQRLDDDILNSILESFESSNIKIRKNKKVVKSKTNILGNDNIKKTKNKPENKLGLLLNKLSKNNINKLVIEFIELFNELTQEDFDIIQRVFFTQLIENGKFQDIIYRFYYVISCIYINKYDLNENEFISLVEQKLHHDYVRSTDDSFFQRLSDEDNRINFLSLILLMNNKFNTKTFDYITNLLLDTTNVPDIYFWFEKNNINVDLYRKKLESKANQGISNRYIILLGNLLGNNHNQIDNMQLSDEPEEKTPFQVSISNFIEEYLFLEDFDEIKDFTSNFTDKEKEIFSLELLDCYFNNKLTNKNKFKNLIAKLYSNKILSKKLLYDSYKKILGSPEIEDYVNVRNKISNLVDIYKFINIKI